MIAQPPQELVRRAASGKAVLFAGAGLSGHALPSWRGLIEKMRSWAEDERALSKDVEETVAIAVQRGELISAAQSLSMRMGADSFQRFLRAVIRDPLAKPGPAHTLIAQLHWFSVLTTNYDRLLEDVLPEAQWRRYTYDQPPELSVILRDDTAAIVKIHGDIDRADKIVIDAEAYRKLLTSPEMKPFRSFMETIFITKTILFLGCSLTDPDILSFLCNAMERTDGHAGPHFALMKTKGMADDDRMRFRQKYGVIVVGDDESDDYPDITGFLRELLKRCRRTTVIFRRVGWALPAMTFLGVWAGTEPHQLLWYLGLGAVSLSVTNWLAQRVPRSDLARLAILAAVANIGPYIIRSVLEYYGNVGYVLHVPRAGGFSCLVIVVAFASAGTGLCVLVKRK